MSTLRRLAGPAPPPQEEVPLAAPLRRFLQPRPGPKPGEACELCAEPLTAAHRHVVDVKARSLKCTCRGCGLLFIERGAAGGQYRTVPDRYTEIVGFSVTGPQWAALQIPVGMAFFLTNSHLEQTVAFYPSPGGATESELSLDAWDGIVAANPALADVEPDVEAALVRTDRDRPGQHGPADRADRETQLLTDGPRCHVVPVDRCYELVGELRMHWRGFDGGQEVRERIAAFFADVQRRSRPPRASSTSASASVGGQP